MTGLYQPKIKDHLIRKLYFLAKKEKKKMTHLINEILEEYLVTEPEPPPYEPPWMRHQPSPDYAKRKERMIKQLMREYHGGGDGTQTQEREDETRGMGDDSMGGFGRTPPTQTGRDEAGRPECVGNGNVGDDSESVDSEARKDCG